MNNVRRFTSPKEVLKGELLQIKQSIINAIARLEICFGLIDSVESSKINRHRKSLELLQDIESIREQIGVINDDLVVIEKILKSKK